MVNQPASNPSSNRIRTPERRECGQSNERSRQCAGVNPIATAVDISKFDIKLYKFNFELRRSNMTNLEVGDLQHTSSIIKDAAKKAALFFGSRTHV
jgi:hypothetical protein